MSTRGYVTILDKKRNIIDAAYLASDAYPSYYGLEILDALEQDHLSSFIQQLREDHPGDVDMIDGIRRDWYIKNSNNRHDYFVDYVYEYTPHKNQLTVYHFGTKALTISTSDLSKYRELFLLDNTLAFPLMFDPVSCTLKKDYYAELQAQLQAGTTLEDLKTKAETPVLYMDYGRLRGLPGGQDSFAKYVRDSTSHMSLRFHAEKFGSKYSLYLQTPFYRAPIASRPLATPAAVEKEIARLLREHPESIRGTMTLFQQIEKYKQELSAAFAMDEIAFTEREEQGCALMEEMLSILAKARQTCFILCDRDDSYVRQIREMLWSAARRARASAEKDKPELTDMIATAETQPTSDDCAKQERNTPANTLER